MKVNSAYEPSGPDQDGAYPGFFNMKRLGVLLLPPGWDASLYSCSKVEELRVKCLDQEYNTMSWPGIEPRLLDLAQIRIWKSIRFFRNDSDPQERGL